MRQRRKPAKSKAKVPVARVRDLEKRLAEALARETTTSEILRVISQSQTDLQPVFEAIVRSAAQLCDATFAVMHRFDGQVVTFDAHYGMTEQEVAGSRDSFPLPTDRGTAVGRAILDRRTTHIHDIRRDAEYRVSAWQRRTPQSTFAGVDQRRVERRHRYPDSRKLGWSVVDTDELVS